MFWMRPDTITYRPLGSAIELSSSKAMFLRIKMAAPLALPLNFEWNKCPTHPLLSLETWCKGVSPEGKLYQPSNVVNILFNLVTLFEPLTFQETEQMLP